jgi:hypothetical protein
LLEACETGSALAAPLQLELTLFTSNNLFCAKAGIAVQQHRLKRKRHKIAESAS